MIDAEEILALKLPEVSQAVSSRDARTYALGIGIGDDPEAEEALAFHLPPEAPAYPTMASVICHPRDSLKATVRGIDWFSVVQGEQALDLFGELPANATYRAQARVVEVLDKGEGKGAVLRIERTLWCADAEAPAARVQNAIFVRGAGGFGGARETAYPQPDCPGRPADLSADIATNPNLALIHRLSGDLNPLHADPGHARKVGFPRPILHGLASYGLAGRGVLAAVGAPAGRLRHLSVRFAKPFFPGETLRVHVWQSDGGGLAFRAEALERGATVLDNGRAELSA